MRWVILLSCFALSGVWAAEPAAKDKAEPPEPIARLLVQEHDSRRLLWVDVLQSADGELTLGTPAAVPGFPKLDPQRQTLVQMGEIKGRIVVGVRDEEEGKFGSGWVLLAAGTRYTDHGDHGHWNYKKSPRVLATKIDAEQGNPAHVYQYDGQFYLANDLKNGYTRLNPEEFYLTLKDEVVVGQPSFIPGGGNHITLATIGNRVGYSAWIDGGGPNKGRVDVSSIGTDSKIHYSFHLPTGVIHGATACAGKVFFAPMDGICWVEADPMLARKADSVQVRHIPLGKEEDKPLRVGAFATHGKFVLAVTGKAASSKMLLIDASAEDPKPVFLPLPGKEGHKPLTPVVLPRPKNPLAFVFQDRTGDSSAGDALCVVELDPNGDGNYDDARVMKTLAVGPSKVKGHYGHHDLGFDAYGKLAYFTNPGDGTISVLDLKSLEIVKNFKIGGQPTALVVVGGRDHHD